MPKKAKSRTDKKNPTGRDEEFPLMAFIAVHEWIGKWVKKTCDPEQRVIAQAAYESLTALGALMPDVMRQ